MDLEHWVNDGLMALFFFVIGLEVRREFSVGELTQPRRAAIPVLAAVGGLVVPALIYVALAPGGEADRRAGLVISATPPSCSGRWPWSAAFTTQLRIFLLTLTVVDDIVAVSVIGLLLQRLPRRWRPGRDGSPRRRDGPDEPLRREPPRVPISSSASPCGWRRVPVASCAPRSPACWGPARRPPTCPPRPSERAARRFRAFRHHRGGSGRSAHRELVRAVSVNERLQVRLHPWASYVVVPVFAFANAGVDLRDGCLAGRLGFDLTWAVVVALVVGKFLGIGLASWAGVRAGLGRLPLGVGFGHVFGGAVLCGIGFTVHCSSPVLRYPSPSDTTRQSSASSSRRCSRPCSASVAFRAAAVLPGGGATRPTRFLVRPIDPADEPHPRPRRRPLRPIEYSDCQSVCFATGVTRELGERFSNDLRFVFPSASPRRRPPARQG